eukprot:TRINITY_DN10323_c1_g1_i1.p1 TRINITY_DN10323_c1_g1~~TRINITY_DN10323_c1_g1_i1.p1  ORF type:complete len:289 (+),score=56.90 TRINITY_DN10323_c1_g1_i1:870-1736(+)
MVPAIAESRNMATFNYLLKSYSKDRQVGMQGTGRRELLWSLARSSPAMQRMLQSKSIDDPYVEQVMPLSEWRWKKAAQPTSTFVIPLSVHVSMVATAAEMQHVLACCQASKHPITFDCEWCPTQDIRDDTKQSMSLFQLAADHQVFVVDAMTNKADFAQFLHALVQDHSLLGFGTQGDSSAIAAVLHEHGMHASNVRVVDILLEVQELADAIPLPNSHHSILRNDKVVASLQTLAKAVCQIDIDKEEQMCDWNRRPLRPECIHYAAMDAYVLLELHNMLQRVKTNGCW